MELKCEPRSPESQASVLTVDTWISPYTTNIWLTQGLSGSLNNQGGGIVSP